MIGLCYDEMLLVIEVKAERGGPTRYVRHRPRRHPVLVDQIRVNDIWALVGHYKQSSIRAEGDFGWVSASISGRGANRTRDWRQRSVLADAESVDRAGSGVE